MTLAEIYELDQKNPIRIRGTNRCKRLVKRFKKAVLLRARGEHQPIEDTDVTNRTMSLFHKLLYDEEKYNPIHIFIAMKFGKISVWHNICSDNSVVADTLSSIAKVIKDEE